MADSDTADRLRQLLEQESNRGLGDISLRATAALAPLSRAQMTAATNLLDKAVRALDDGDEARARRFVERAVALPFDEHERVHPAAMMVHQRLFVAVTEALEDGGDGWLGAAVDTFASGSEEARYCLRDILMSVMQDYELTVGEERRVRRLISDVPERAELYDLDLAPPEMAATILAVLEGIIHYVDAYEELIGDLDAED